MDIEKKKEFTLRITQANTVELIIVLYEMTICYIDDVINFSHADNNSVANPMNNIEYQNSIRRANNCIEELMNNLHYEYSLAKNLKEIYLYMKKQLRLASVTGNTEELIAVKKQLNTLKSAYESVKSSDGSRPIMSNTQTVLMGMTYDRNRALDSLTTEYTKRGYRV